jgi:hypothetical protein
LNVFRILSPEKNKSKNKEKELGIGTLALTIMRLFYPEALLL